MVYTLAFKNPFPWVNWREQAFDSAYTLASYLTDPCCAAHRYYRQIFVIDTMYPQAAQVEKIARKSLLFIGIIASGALAVITTPFGICIRYIASSIQSRPFLYCQGEGREKPICNHTLTLFSWNVCGAPAGYSITDGGVVPWQWRTKSLIGKILEQKSDVVCLYEVSDIQMTHVLIEGMKKKYAHFYYHINPKYKGPPSALFVASKVKIVDPKCLIFPAEALDGRGKHSNKAVFYFDVQPSNKKLLSIFTTHLQHSEIPAVPQPKEIRARGHAMELILREIAQIKDRPVVVTGDLNLDDTEYNLSSWSQEFDHGNCAYQQEYTWGGDVFCATQLTHKIPSQTSNLDHTLLLRGSSVQLQTRLISAGFNSTQFNLEALSDHQGLLSTLTF